MKRQVIPEEVLRTEADLAVEERADSETESQDINFFLRVKKRKENTLRF